MTRERKAKRTDRRIRESTYGVIRAARAAIRSGYDLAPGLVIVLALTIAGVVSIALLSSKLMIGVVLLVVLGVALVVYVGTNNYGEAALALVAGLLTAYSVSWTPSRFMGFIAVWSGFSFIALIISRLKLATKTEEIYRQAALALADEPSESKEIEIRMKSTAADVQHGLGPIERAETLRIFAFRKLPLDVMPTGLRAVGMISVITSVDAKQVANFVADVYRIFDAVTTDHADIVVALIYDAIRKSAAPPADFIAAVEHSRRLVLTGSIQPDLYFSELQRALDDGIAPEAMGDYLAPFGVDPPT